MLEKMISEYRGTHIVAPIAAGISARHLSSQLDCTNGDCYTGDGSGECDQNCSTSTYD